MPVAQDPMVFQLALLNFNAKEKSETMICSAAEDQRTGPISVSHRTL